MKSFIFFIWHFDWRELSKSNSLFRITKHLIEWRKQHEEMGKGTLSIAGGVVLLACAGGYYMYKNYFPKEPERIVYDKERVLQPIHNQLKGINIENVKMKEKEVVNATVDELQKND